MAALQPCKLMRTIAVAFHIRNPLYHEMILYECNFFRFISVYDFIPIKFNCALTIDIVGKQVYWNPEKLQIINEQAWSDSGKKELWDGMEEKTCSRQQGYFEY